MNTEPIEAEVVNPELALTKHEPKQELEKPKTAQELRAVEVSAALLPAYERASTLELTDDEIARLSAPFSDEYVEIRPHDGLIYIPHIHISDRLNQVLKPGKWALPCRRHWMENGTMYGEYILLIRGCYVGESIGGHPYQPNNPKVNFSDSLESTAAEALRRICGKRLSCGSQVWNPEYARNWVSKYGVQIHGKWSKRMDAKAKEQPAQPAEEHQPIQFNEAKFRKDAEAWIEDNKNQWVNENSDVKMWATLVVDGAILLTEPVSAVTWTKLWPHLLKQLDEVIVLIRAGKLSENAAKRKLNIELIQCKKDYVELSAKTGIGPDEQAAYDEVYSKVNLCSPQPDGDPKSESAISEATGEDEWFWDVICPIPHRGEKRSDYEKNPDTIGSLYEAMKGGDEAAQKRLWGFARGWAPEPRTVNGKTYQPSEADLKFREALNDFMSWHDENETTE